MPYFFLAMFISLWSHAVTASDRVMPPPSSGLEKYYQPRKYKDPGKNKLRGIKGTDNRTLIEKNQYPWSAIGRLNKDIGGFCTGTLIAPDLVLTAAHCLWDKKRNRWLKPNSLFFLAGYRRGNFIANSVATKFHISPSYKPKNGKRLSVASKDWAILELKNNLSNQVGTIAIAPVDRSYFNNLMAKKTPFIQAGYSQDKAHILSVNKRCPMKAYNKKFNVMVHTCDAVNGDSGSPIFYKDKGQYKIASIHVATTKKGQSEGIAVSAISITNHLKKIGLWEKVRSPQKPKKS